LLFTFFCVLNLKKKSLLIVIWRKILLEWIKLRIRMRRNLFKNLRKLVK
jgi:hypothetical protein